MLKKLTLLSALVLTGISTEANAFGLRVHLYIADQILEDVNSLDGDQCTVTIAKAKQALPPEVCKALKDHPEAFRAGAIGPDAFPDLVVGQSFVHPGTKDGRQTADWLNLMLSKATEPKELAYAYGNVIHAAGDVFAHSYVNNYAGGVFDLFSGGDVDIEARHVKLEKYIDQRLEYDPKIEKLDIPASFILDTMVRTNYIPINKKFEKEDLQALFLNPEGELSKIIGSKIKAGTPGYHMMMMWGFLAIAENEERLAPCEAVRSVDATTKALRAYLIAEQDARLVNLNEVEKGTYALLDLSDIYDGKTPCTRPTRLQMRGYPIIEGFQHEDKQIRAQNQSGAALLSAKYNYQKLLIAGEFKKDDFPTNRRNEWWEQLPSKNHTEMSDTYENFLTKLEAQHDAEALQIFTDFWADDMRMAVEEYMKASLETARDMVESSAPFPQSNFDGESGAVHYSRWFDCYSSTLIGQPIAAAKAHCERQKALGNGTTLSSTARNAAIGKLNRDIYYRVLSISRWIDKKMTEVLFDISRVVAPSLTDLVDTLINPTRIGRDDLDKQFKKNKNGQIQFECVSDWIDADLGMLEKWPDAEFFPNSERNEFRPNVDCLKESTGDYKKRSREHINPEKFLALNYAIRLGKLSLLSRDGVHALTEDLAKQSSKDTPAISDIDFDKVVADLEMSNEAQYSILIDMVRSIDGSYQWNGNSMPYPREKGHKSSKVKLKKVSQNDGYPADNKSIIYELELDLKLDKHTDGSRKGFPLYQTPELRLHVFSKIFPEPFEGEILKAKEFGQELYPFTPCKGDPFRPRYVGEDIHNLCNTSKSKSKN